MHRSKLSGVLHKGFKPDKCKIALKMAMARIKLLRNKKEAQVRQMRREVAQLLDGNQDQTARIRVRLASITLQLVHLIPHSPSACEL